MTEPQDDASAEEARLGGKIFAGPRVRRLRRERGQNQSEMAAALGFSVSYLNLVERNQRPLSARFLVRLAEVYGVDLTAFAGSDEARAYADLMEILADPLFEGLGLARSDMRDLAETSPQAVEGFRRLYGAWRDAKQAASDLSHRVVEGSMGEDASPVTEVRDFIQAARNHFPVLESAAEQVTSAVGVPFEETQTGLMARLDEIHGVRVRLLPSDVMGPRPRFYDHHRRELQLSELLPSASRTFQLAYQVGLFEAQDAVAETLTGVTFASDEAQAMARRALASYFAGAVMMPYGAFLASAEALKYDIDHLALRFCASFEQVAHRLTTLSRPGAKGVPFFFIRLDKAGHVSKRFSAGASPFARFGGTCPLMAVHDAFAHRGSMLTQAIEMPDGAQFLMMARTVSRARPHPASGLKAPDLAIGLGCPIDHAGSLVYGDQAGPTPGAGVGPDHHPVPVGPTCRLCDRRNCPARAMPRVGER